MRNPPCPTEKKKMADRMTAEKKARYMEQKFHELYSAYKCRECGFWHVGHRIPRIVRENEVRI